MNLEKRETTTNDFQLFAFPLATFLVELWLTFKCLPICSLHSRLLLLLADLGKWWLLRAIMSLKISSQVGYLGHYSMCITLICSWGTIKFLISIFCLQWMEDGQLGNHGPPALRPVVKDSNLPTDIATIPNLNLEENHAWGQAVTHGLVFWNHARVFCRL